MLNFVLARGWTDHDNFSSKLAKRIVNNRPRSAGELIRAINTFQGSFFKLNNVPKKRFIENFPVREIIEILGDYIEIGPITFLDVFPETANIIIDEGKKLVSKLDVDESLIQDAIRDSLREKNATNPIERGHDSVLEVADHEHFSLEVKGIYRAFAGVVKGYGSVRGKTVKWKDIAYQVMRAYNRTQPDHILLVLSKDPSDSVVSELIQYGKSVINPNLVILCDPVTLARFLKARNSI